MFLKKISLILIILFGFFGCIKNKSTTAQNRLESANQKPLLTKLPFAFSQAGRTPMENTPVIFNSRPLLVANYRPSGPTNLGDKDSYLYIDDLETGEEITRFGIAHSFASAIVNDDELNVFALDFSDSGEVWKSNGINRFVTNDLENWNKEKVILPEGDELLFNTSVCRDDKGFLMAYESNLPVKFCFKFARSNDLSNWEKIPGIIYTGESDEYSACPVIRYFKPFYYVIYLHAPMDGHNGWISYLARSKDLNIWDLSPFNPLLEAEGGEGINNSDVDIFEYEGRTYLYYAIGDQATWTTVRTAMFDGPLDQFFESHFPSKMEFTKVSAKH